jgi:hypothetical protein
MITVCPVSNDNKCERKLRKELKMNLSFEMILVMSILKEMKEK